MDSIPSELSNMNVSEMDQTYEVVTSEIEQSSNMDVSEMDQTCDITTSKNEKVCESNTSDIQKNKPDEDKNIVQENTLQ
uniref:Ovule protein n=1 Tax=Strongyloides stercoralis TaxID=6248 RepID=A0A0K0EMN4_STRER